MNVQTLSLINGSQALLLALMLWFGTRNGSDHALRGLRLRAVALLLEACGDFVLAFDVLFSQLAVLLGGNAFNLATQALTVAALRMVLGRELRWRQALLLAVVGWSGEAWLSTAYPDYRLRVLWGSTVLVCYALLNISVLWNGARKPASRAHGLLLLAYLLDIALLAWRNVTLWMLIEPPKGIGEPSTVNVLYVLLFGLQPLLASVGFLLLYNEVLQRELHELARIDPLTGISNRLGLLEASETLLLQARAKQESIGVLLIDADHFKSVNDRFGHDDGDRVLLELVSSIRCTLRAGDMVGRVGGEEFLVLSPSVQESDLLALAERIRMAVECTPFQIGGQAYSLTVSIGAAIAHATEVDMTAARRRADMALYEAKRSGRNCVMVSA